MPAMMIKRDDEVAALKRDQAALSVRMRTAESALAEEKQASAAKIAEVQAQANCHRAAEMKLHRDSLATLLSQKRKADEDLEAKSDELTDEREAHAQTQALLDDANVELAEAQPEVKSMREQQKQTGDLESQLHKLRNDKVMLKQKLETANTAHVSALNSEKTNQRDLKDAKTKEINAKMEAQRKKDQAEIKQLKAQLAKQQKERDSELKRIQGDAEKFAKSLAAGNQNKRARV